MQYTPFASDVELPFYTSLASLKINHDKLDDSARKVVGLYEIRSTDAPESSCRMQVHGNALISDEAPVGFYRAEGIIKNFNTIEEFRNADRPTILQMAGTTIWEAINDGTIYSCPSLLASFIVISYGDLKKYKFHYWFGFPALHSLRTWVPAEPAEPQGNNKSESSPIVKSLTGRETTTLVDAVQTWKHSVDARQHGFFLAKKLREADNQDSFSWSIASLGTYESGFFDNARPDDRYVCFADPSNYPNAPGWMLRNLLVLVGQRWNLHEVQILCYRDVQSKRDYGRSLSVKLVSEQRHQDQPQVAPSTGQSLPRVTGWERNSKGKLLGRIVDLAAYMDPQRLANQAVDLNLKLIKWRISPKLDLDKIKSCSCLLLGAGTLGSYVARNLMGWGVRKITFIDNGSVSFSNPVRQPLFVYQDCLNGGSKKAARAADALKEIYPGVESRGHVLSVPMPGHPTTDIEKTKAEYEHLEKLVLEHDAVFLLMDSRESRWLPTVMGKAAGKIVMNAALGFDTFVVMRHGVKASNESSVELGCYFCNDVVAPMDSLKDQTLDQQCTVTRPGLAAIASALLVELFVSILQHPAGVAAPAPQSVNTERGDHPLGLVPHQIRGFLSNFTNLSVTGSNYDCCSACSDKIISAYKTYGWEFVQKALNDKGYIEELSGLREVQQTAEASASAIEWDDESDDGVM